MSNSWDGVLRFAAYMLIIVGGLAYLSKLFGGHILTDIRSAFPKEFKSKMGVFSFVGFLVIAYFTFDQAVFEHLASLLEPASAGVASYSPHDSELHVEVLVGALIVALLGNLLIIARISDTSRR